MPPAADLLSTFPPFARVQPLIAAAIEEDLGGPVSVGRDLTSLLTISEDERATGTLVQKSPGVVAGLPLVDWVCKAYDPALEVVVLKPLSSVEAHFSPGDRLPLIGLRGPLRSMLAAERVVLNFLQRLSGIATLTHRFVRETRGTRAQILDTRKTLPGYRLLEKYAVRAGGGHNHRTGLYDGILIKDNHLAGRPLGDIAPWLSGLVARARQEFESAGKIPFQVEVDTLEQLAEVLRVDGVDRVLLDNMDCPTLARAVQMRDSAGRGGTVLLEASGGVTLETVRAIAETGVDRISVGAITHSAPALDISLDREG